MVVLNFSCTEKRKALEDHTCSQTIRTSVKKFCKPMQVYPILDVIERKPYTMWYPLHIWWNARNFHVEDVCECGHTRIVHPPNLVCSSSGHSAVLFPCAGIRWDKCDCGKFKLAKQGLGPKKFLGMGEITSIVRKKVSKITPEDAWADGFPTRDTCVNWILRHNENLTLDSYVYVIRWRWL